MNHTPTPWSQGITIIKDETKYWTQKQIKSNNYEQRRRIFSNFRLNDEGRSRKIICVCEDEINAKFIVKAVNNHEVLLNALKLAQKALSNHWFTVQGEEEYNNYDVIESDKLCQQAIQQAESEE